MDALNGGTDAYPEFLNGSFAGLWTCTKSGARRLDLANLVFEPPASRGSAIQTDFCRPSAALISWR